VRRVRFLRNPLATQIGNNVDEFIDYLAGPACLFLDGDNSDRTRAFVTLLHGNEPSGLMALFRWLKSGQRPAVNTVCIVASVPAAAVKPRFSHRMLPDVRDLNRCFRPPFADEPGQLAEEILEILRMHHPEAVIDMHNTSGSGPAFGVCTHMDRQHDALVSIFTQRLIVSNLGLGALMDISEHSYPTVTIEVGGRQDQEAHELAYEGLCRYFTASTVLDQGETDWGLELLHDPLRLELNPGFPLTYAEQACSEHAVTLLPDIEHHNFGTVSPETQLGWTDGVPKRLFTALDAGGRCAVARLVRVEEGRLYPAQPLKLFMITTNAFIAQSDCLFYAVADDGEAISS
jgi:hypothetical protein